MKRTKTKTTRGFDGIDAGNRAAEAVRSLIPPDVPMEPGARERVMSRALAAAREDALPAPRRSFARAVVAPAVALVIVAAVIVGALLPVFLGGGSDAPSALAATIEDRAGEVELKSEGAGWRDAPPGAELRAGVGLRTGEGSSASVRFPDGSVMRVGDASEAKVMSLGRGSVGVSHVSGGTYHRVRPGTDYVVSSRDVSSRALGTAFNVDSRQPGNIEILCVESSVEVAILSHEPIEVAEGQVMTVSTRRDRRAEKAPVSRERLLDERLCANVRSDAEAGFSTGIYSELDLPLDAPAEQTAAERPIELRGSATGKVVALEWSVSEKLEQSALVLLRSELSEPAYPAGEIARYADTSINSGTDGSVSPGKTYQYRIAALSPDGEVAGYSNTLVIPVKGESDKVPPASISLRAASAAGGVTLDWSVSKMEKFSGFVLERTVQKAPAGSETPGGTVSTRRIETSSVFYTYKDDTAAAGHAYTYRVGLVVDGAVLLYSAPVTAEPVRQ